MLPYSLRSTNLLPKQPLWGYAQIFPKLRDTDRSTAFEEATQFNHRLVLDPLDYIGSMSLTEATQSNEYDLVSSFYGPGVVVGWYLTALACLISFSLHPLKRTHDSITADLIAVLIFPTVAAVDTITRVRAYNKEGVTSAQNAASVDATQVVTRAFLIVDFCLYLLAEDFKCRRRACLLAFVGLFFFTVFTDFLAQSMAWLLLGTPGGVLPIVVNPKVRGPDIEATRRDWKRDFLKRHNAMALGIISVFCLLCIFLGLLLLHSRALLNSPSQFLPWIRTAASQIPQDWIPMSNISIKELDQAVALLAGTSVLGFSLYSTADAYYQAWLSETRAVAQQQDIELRTLDRNQAPHR